MKISLFNMMALILTIFLILPPGLVRANDYEAYQQAVTVTENATARIRMAEGAVGQVLAEAFSGKYGEYHKWSLIEEKMAALDTAIDSSLSEISGAGAPLLKQDPNYRFPSIQLGHPFEGNLNMARDKKRELLELAKQENAKLQKLNDMLAKVNKALLNATKGAVGDTMEGFFPNEEQLGGEAAVIVLGAYFGPPGMAVAGLAVFATFTFNTVVSTYYTSKALADQIKALNPMKEMLEANKKTTEQNVKILNDGASEMLQIEQVLDKQQKKMDGHRQKISKAEESWGNQSQGAYQARQAEIVAQAKAQAAAPKNPINPYGHFYGMPPIPPIQPSEYAGEIDSFVVQMESYSKAVEDGGEPDNFDELVAKWEKAIVDKIVPVQKDHDQKYAAYQQASEVCWQKRSAAYQQFNASWRSLWAAYQNKRWDDAARAAEASMSAAYNAADQAALAALAPYGQVLAAPVRELAKLSAIRYGAQGAFYGFRQRVETAVTYRSNEFGKKLWHHIGNLNDATAKTGQALLKIPYYSKGYKERAENIDSEVSRALDWGADVMSLRAGLFSTADQMKTMGKDVKEGIKEYETAMLEVRRILNVGQSEMKSFIAKYGKLVNHPRAGRYYLNLWGSAADYAGPNTTETSERVKWLSEYVTNNLSYEEPAYLEEAKKIDWEGLARIYENKANDLNSYVDWAEQYRNRQSVAANRLDKICRNITGLGFYAAPGSDSLKKEFSEPPWSSIIDEIKKYAPESGFKKLPWANVQPWDGMSPWQKVYAAQTILYYRMSEEMKSHVQARANGGFFPVPEDIIKPIEEDWKGLRVLCEKYDALAKPIRDKIRNSPEEVNKEIAAVSDIWNKMPALSRNLMNTEYSRFRNAANFFSEYLRKTLDAMKPMLEPPNNSVSVQLDNIIGNYRPELEKWKAQQKKMQDEAEKRQREYEEEQAKVKAAEEAQRKAEEEQQKKEQEKSTASLSAVSGLYDKFKQAYESRNDSQVISFMGDDWEAGDGTTLSDLQENISRSFRTFDEIKYNIQNLKIELRSEGQYMVSYDVTITSRIYKRNMKHEEKSSVNEEVVIDGSGKPRITRTMNGRFWYVE